MKILMVNKFFYIKGGSETYYFTIKEMLENNGHQVIDFSMKDEKNFESKYSKYFIRNINYNQKQNIVKKFVLGFKIIYNFEAKRKFKKLIKNTKPDVIHLNIFQHQLSSSIVNVAHKMKIPMIYTAHDLQALCPNYKMYNKSICEKCKKHKYYTCIKEKCVKESYVKSCISCVDSFYNLINKTYEKINFIITPSMFYKKKFIEYGFNGSKIIYLPNPLNINKIIYDDIEYKKNKYYVYIGRLSDEKGINTLIKAFKGGSCNLKIIGDGPMRDYIHNIIDSEKINNIELLGYKSGKELYTIVRNSRCLIIPSEWYENGPYSAIEALCMSVPIIGANIGGIPELIEDKKNGFVFKAFNSDDLKDKINKMEVISDEEYISYRNASYVKFLEKHQCDSYYSSLIKLYESTIKMSNRS